MGRFVSLLVNDFNKPSLRGFVCSDKSSIRLNYLLIQPLVLSLLFVQTFNKIIECVLEFASQGSI
jgi:hypothetical protein